MTNDINTVSTRSEAEKEELRKIIEATLESSLKNIQPSNTAETSRIATGYRLPQFNEDDPEWWFKSVEAYFTINKLSKDEDFLLHLTLNMPDRLKPYLDAVDNITLSDGDTKYKKFKEKVINAFRVSQEAKLKEILRGIPIGNLKPSHYFIILKQKAGNMLDDRTLKSIFLDRLPRRTREAAILKSPDLSCDQLAELADKLHEEYQHYKSAEGHLSAVQYQQQEQKIDPIMINEICQKNIQAHNVVQVSKIDSSMAQMQAAIATLTAQISSLTAKMDNMQAEVSDLKRRNNRGRSQSRGRKPEKEKNPDFCWKHNKFGKDARDCVPPCAWKYAQKTGSGND